MKSQRWLTALLTLALAACGDTYIGSPTEPDFPVLGSGALVTQSRPVSNFDSVLLTVPGELLVEQTGMESLTITAAENLIDELTSEVVGGTLELRTRSDINMASRQTIVYRLTVRRIEDVVVSGAARVEANGIEGERFTFTLSGAADVTISGAVHRQVLTISGAGHYNAANLSSEIASITLSGAGHATIRASRRIDGVISGAGILEYYGDPEVDVSVSGTGSIRQIGN